MSAQRVVLLFTEDTNASEDLVAAIDMAAERPWRPRTTEQRVGEQERYSEEETDSMILTFLKRAVKDGRVKVGAQVFVP